MEQEVSIERVSKGMKAQCPPNPEYPEGKDVDATLPGQKGKWVELPYPAAECGTWVISGPELMTIGITAAGRPDDPRNVKIPYKSKR